jgi:SAM-dependent methyltransferase
MMAYIDRTARDIASMPRGGPDASRLDRRLQTNRLEYLDRDDVDDLKRKVIRSLDRLGRLFGQHKKFARMALGEVANIPSPKILELGCGHGGLSRKLLENHPTAQVTVTDIDPTFVAAAAASDLGSHPRATVREMDATAIDAPDGYYDLVVFALSLHHLPFSGLSPSAHDGFISSLRAYSPSALRALACYADPAITVEFRTRGRGQTVAVASRAGQTGNRQRDHEP